jgi:ABC-type nickel/cobalt efflux system permease component RcnA
MSDLGPGGRTAMMKRTSMWTLALASLASAAVLALSGSEMALGVALGALLGLVNVWLLSRALSRLVDNAGDHRPAPGSKWTLPAVLLLKWPAILLALAVILWYMPARPEGVARGALLSLAAASIAARQGQRGRSVDADDPTS